MGSRLTRRNQFRIMLWAFPILTLGILIAVERSNWERSAGSPGVEKYVYRFVVMGTEAEITIAAASEESAQRAAEAAKMTLDRVNGLMSDYIPASDIGRLNRAEAGTPVPVDKATFEVLKGAVAFAQRTGGAFDVTYAPLRRLWRECAKRASLPKPEELEAARALVGFENLILDEAACTAALARPGMEVDLGGIAKGFGVDLAAKAMQACGVKGGIVNVGGNMYLLGTNPSGGHWSVGVLDPARPDDKNHFLTTIRGHDVAISTSGNYHRFFEIGGKKYSHIIDPRTGQPADNVPSVTVIAPDGMTADALSTAISVLGPQEGLKLAESISGVEALIVENTAGALKQYRTSGFFAYETLTGSENASNQNTGGR